MKLSRRLFLASSAAFAATPAFGRPAAPPTEQPADVPRTGNVDVVVVGAGAAGIAAARRLTAAGRTVALIEASNRVGGRCFTDTATFGVPYDRGAHWIHTPEFNPVARLAPQAGVEIYPAPPGQRARIARRYARETEMEDFLAGVVLANRAIADAARKGKDISCAQALPKELGDWRRAIEFILGPYTCSKDLTEVSAIDHSRLAERDRAAFCRQGYGTLLAKLAPESVQLATPATRIEWGGRSGVEVETPKGKLGAQGVIITVSTDVLAAGKIKFNPELPKRQLDAAARLKLGSHNRVALLMPENPLGLRSDEPVFEKSRDARTGALFANVAGSTLCFVDVAGKFGNELATQGEKAMVDFAIAWLTGLYGSNIAREVKRSHVMRWSEEPWVMGAVSAAAPGWQPARKTLMEPLRNRIWLAGEAVHETQWGTVGGAWESGERAAADLLGKLGKPPAPDIPQRPKPKRKPPRRQRPQ